jgi:hypothetical protein
MNRRILAVIASSLLMVSAAKAQSAEATLSLNEGFFDSFLDAVFQNFDPPEFAIKEEKTSGCNESIRVLREMNGVKTAVRFREGKINVPLAFSGHYSAPFVGCVEFSGWAESNIDLEFDREGQRLIGRAHILNVNLNGSGGVGGSMIARMLQSSVDKKLNPIEILKLEKLSFGIPIEDRGTIRLRATDVRPEVTNGQLVLHLTYGFVKG